MQHKLRIYPALVQAIIGSVYTILLVHVDPVKRVAPGHGIILWKATHGFAQQRARHTGEQENPMAQVTVFALQLLRICVIQIVLVATFIFVKSYVALLPVQHLHRVQVQHRLQRRHEQ